MAEIQKPNGYVSDYSEQDYSSFQPDYISTKEAGKALLKSKTRIVEMML